MTDFVTFLVFCQALGASVGAVTVIWGEFAYIRATSLAVDGKSRQVRDEEIDVAERAHLNIIAKGLRFGMTLLLLASFGLVIVAYILQAVTQPALTPAYWILIMLSLLVIGISWALSRKKVSFAVGSAIIFTAWWFLSYLTLGWLPQLSFGSAIALLLVATVVTYALFHYIRLLSGHFAQK